MGLFYNDAVKKLTANSVYTGTVVRVDTYRHVVDVDIVRAGTLKDCIYAPGAVAGLLGVATSSLPPVGSDVAVLYTGQSGSWIIGATSDRYPGKEEPPYSISGDKDADVLALQQFKPKDDAKEDSRAGVYGSPADMFPGELELNTGTGVMMRLLFGLAQLNAGDMAKVEAHLLNDMVRIIDNYFVHHSCGGDEYIWGSGNRTVKEEHFTSYFHEAEGKKEPTEKLATMENSGEIDFDSAVENKYSDTGRWRLSDYYGFLGDMIHRFVTSPTEVASNVMEESFRAGQYRSWIGSDGTLLIQSAGGVHVEVTQYIVIPAILKQWNDPDFDCAKALEELNGEFLKVWGTGPDWQDLKLACWQMNYYLKYITLFHSLSRFKQMEEKEYCKIPTEKDAPERKPDADQEDVKIAAPGSDSRMPGHAAFVMDPAGSVSLISNGDTSVIMNQGNIQIACPGNLEFKVGGNISMTGQNVSIQGTKDVEVLSVFGSLSLKARTLWQALCEAGTLWLKGDAKDDGSSAFEASSAYPLESEEPEVKFNAYSVVIDASQGKTLVHGAKGAVLGSTDEEAHVYVQATGSDADVYVASRRDIMFKATRNIVNGCLNWITTATKSYFGSMLVKIGEYVAIMGGMMAVKSIRSDMFSVRSVVMGMGKNVSDSDYEALPDPDEIIRSDAALELSDMAHEVKQELQ